MKKYYLGLLLFLMTAFINSYIYSADDNSNDKGNVTNEKQEIKKETALKNKLAEELKSTKKLINKLKKELANYNKLIDAINDGLIKSLEQDKINKLQENKNSLLLKKIEINQQIVELQILYNKQAEELSNKKKEMMITADGTLNWSKTFDISNPVVYRPGTWHILVKATDNMNNTSNEEAINIKIDPISDIPKLTVINPSVNARVTSNLRIVGTAYDDDEIGKVILFIDDSKDEKICNGKDFWYYDLDTTNMSDGNHILRFKVYDIKSVGSKETVVPFKLDRKTPYVEIESGLKEVMVSDKILMAGTANDGNGIQTVEYSIDNRINFYKVPSIKHTDKYKTKANWALTLNSNILIDGVQTIWIRATDNTGSFGFAPLTLIVDHKKPVIKIQYPMDNTNVDSNFTVMGYAEDNVGIKKVTFTIKGSGSDGKEQEVTLIPGNIFWTYDADLSNLNSGRYQLIASVEDISGNITSSIVMVNLDKDLDKPVLTLKSIKKDDRFSNSLPLFGTIVDDDEAKEVKVKILKEGNKETVFEDTIPAKYSLFKDIDISNEITFPEGKYTIELAPFDINDVRGNQVKESFIIDRSYPKFDSTIINQWAGKSFAGKIELNLNIIKYGNLRSVNYSILEALSMKEIIGAKEIKYKSGDQSGIFKCDPIKEDFTSLKAKPSDGILLVNLQATDDLNNKTSIMVPIVLDMKNPSIILPTIDNNKGLIKDEEITLDDNLIIKNASISISSSNKDFKTITDSGLVKGDIKEYTLNTKQKDGKFTDYTINMEVSDLAGNTNKNSFKITFKETKEDNHTITIKVIGKDRTAYSDVPMIFMENDTMALDAQDLTLYGFIPENYNSPVLENQKKLMAAEDINLQNGIFNFKFTNDERKDMKIGNFTVKAIFKTNDGKQTTKDITVFNDVKAPNLSVIWPPAYIAFNKNFSLYGMASDDSGSVKVKYLTDENIPKEFKIDYFEQNILNKLSGEQNKKIITELYAKEKDGYKLKKDSKGESLLNACEILDNLNYAFEYNENEIDKKQDLTYKVNLLDPLINTKTQTLQEYITQQKIPVLADDRIFKINLPVDKMDEGEHFVYVKADDSSGRSTVKKTIFMVDKTNPQIEMLSLKPEEEKTKSTLNKNQSSAKSKDKNNEFTNDEAPEESDQPDQVGGGEITLRGSASDNYYLSDIVIKFNDDILLAKGRKNWDTLYNINKIKAINLNTNEPLPYTIELYALDLAGNKTIIDRKILIDISQDSPNLFINNPAVDNQRYTGIIDLAGVALDDAGIDYVQYRLDYTAPAVDPKNPKPDTGGWEKIDVEKITGKWNKQLPIESIKPGRHIMEAQAVDIYGMKSDIKKISFHLDLENPSIIITGPNNAEYIKGETTITGKAIDPNEIESVEISTNYGWSYAPSEGKDNWRYYFNSFSVPDGPMRFLVKAKDKAGSEAFNFNLYNIDNTSPEIDILLPKDGAKINNKFRIIGRARDNIGIDKIKLYINTDDRNRLPNTDTEGFVNVQGKEAWYYDINTANWDPQKTYHIITRVYDFAGNITEKSLDFKVDPASDLPIIEMDQPQPGQHMTGEVLNFFGSAEDDEGIEGVYIKIDDAEEIKVKGTTIWNYSLPTITMTSGLHRVAIYAKDIGEDGKTGKKSTVISRVFYLDESGPVLNITSHLSGAPVGHRPWLFGNCSYYEKDLELKLKHQIQEKKLTELKKKYRRTPEKIPAVNTISVSTYEVKSLKYSYLASNQIKSILLSLDNGKTYEQGLGFKPNWQIRLQTQKLDNGSHMLQFKTVSFNNNESINYFRVKVDKTVPTVIIDKPEENLSLNEQIAVRGSANDNGKVEEVKIALRQFDKNLGKIPKFIQGLYLWLQAFGGPWISGGIGFSFFDDVVRVEGLFGWIATRENIRDCGTDPDNIPEGSILRTNPEIPKYNPRYCGFVTGGKLLARVIDIPFEFFWGEDARNFSISVEIGCGFYWYSGFGGATDEINNKYYHDKRIYDIPENQQYSATLDGRVIAGFMYQIDFFKVERYGILRKFALYFENAFYFVASEIEGGLVPQFGFGIRNALF